LRETRSRCAHKPARSLPSRQFSDEEKIRIVLEGLRGEESIAELCRRQGITTSMYYGWSKEFLEAEKARLTRQTGAPRPAAIAVHPNLAEV